MKKGTQQETTRLRMSARSRAAAPDAFLLLKIAQLPDAKNQQGRWRETAGAMSKFFRSSVAGRVKATTMSAMGSPQKQRREARAHSGDPETGGVRRWEG